MRRTIYCVAMILMIIVLAYWNNISSGINAIFIKITSSTSATFVKESSSANTTFVKETTRQTTTEISSVKKQLLIKEFKNSCKPFVYKDIIRNPNKYYAKNYKLTGKVMSINNEEHDIRLQLTDYYKYSDLPGEGYVFLKIKLNENDDRIFVNDIITVYGKSYGEFTYLIADNNGLTPKTLLLINVYYYDLES